VGQKKFLFSQDISKKKDVTFTLLSLCLILNGVESIKYDEKLT
jgi:hypothetical protein